MSKSRKPGAAPTVATEYDFPQGVRGKHARRYAEGTNVIVLEPDVAAVARWPDFATEAQLAADWRDEIRKTHRLTFP